MPAKIFRARLGKGNDKQSLDYLALETETWESRLWRESKKRVEVTHIIQTHPSPNEVVVTIWYKDL